MNLVLVPKNIEVGVEPGEGEREEEGEATDSRTLSRPHSGLSQEQSRTQRERVCETFLREVDAKDQPETHCPGNKVLVNFYYINYNF